MDVCDADGAGSDAAASPLTEAASSSADVRFSARAKACCFGFFSTRFDHFSTEEVRRAEDAGQLLFQHSKHP